MNLEIILNVIFAITIIRILESIVNLVFNKYAYAKSKKRFENLIAEFENLSFDLSDNDCCGDEYCEICEDDDWVEVKPKTVKKAPVKKKAVAKKKPAPKRK